jgi:recombination protein RecT
MSNAITTKQDIKSLINSESMREQFSRALPKHLDAERFCRIAITATTRTPKLMDCTPASVMKCLLDLSAMGLEPDGRRAHLIPYGSECTLIIDYKGLIELIRRSGDVTSIRAETVCEKDGFSWENGIVTHQVDWRNPRGEVQAVYAEAKLSTGEVQTAVMTKDEVEAIRSRSRSGNNGPWKTDWCEMAKKTAVRRLTKMLPLSSELREHVEKDDERTFETRNVTPRPGFAAYAAAAASFDKPAALAAPAEQTSEQAFEAELAQEEEA